MDRRIALYTFPLLAATWWGMVAHAADAPVTDRVSFYVEASREVQNDQASAVLQVQAEGRDAAKLADDINRNMGWALKQARTVKTVTAQSGNYRTYPVYEKNRIVRWRGAQELRLESRDIAALGRLIGTLQARLQMQSMQFSVSRAAREAVEGALIDEALAAFRKRAARIATGLDASGYTLLDISIDKPGGMPVTPVRLESMARLKTASVTAPAVEQGSSEMRVRVSGSVHLLRK